MSDIEAPLSPPDDAIVPFQVADSPVRGRLIRLGAAIDDILSVHPFEPRALELVGEGAVLTALMGSTLKFDGKLIFQAQGDGPVAMLVADYHASGALRATAKVTLPLGERRGLRALLGDGHLALTIDQGPDMERYQGVTPLEGEGLAEAAVSYFMQSEQIPTAIRLAVGRSRLAGGREAWRAGGVMIQFVPGEGGGRERGEAALRGPEEQELWDRAAALLATTQADELLDPLLSPHDLLYRLYHDEGVRVFEPRAVRAECGCTSDRIARVLSRYDSEALSEMVEDGEIRVDCEFCRTRYLFDAAGAFLGRGAKATTPA